MVVENNFVEDVAREGYGIRGLVSRKGMISVQEVIRQLGLDPASVCERLSSLARNGEVEVLHPVGEDPFALMRGLPPGPDHVYVRCKRKQDSRHAWQAGLCARAAAVSRMEESLL